MNEATMEKLCAVLQELAERVEELENALDAAFGEIQELEEMIGEIGGGL